MQGNAQIVTQLLSHCADASAVVVSVRRAVPLSPVCHAHLLPLHSSAYSKCKQSVVAAASEKQRAVGVREGVKLEGAHN